MRALAGGIESEREAAQAAAQSGPGTVPTRPARFQGCLPIAENTAAIIRIPHRLHRELTPPRVWPSPYAVTGFRYTGQALHPLVRRGNAPR